MENVEHHPTDVNGAFDIETRTSINSIVLDYYKKFGRKRDLEQFFCLSTAQCDISDPTSIFWRKIKMQNDSSDSGERSGGSPNELCRISIKCSIPEASTSQDDSESPPILTEEVVLSSPIHNDVSVKSDDNNSQKSNDIDLNTSTQQKFSPTSSITSQRKLEWDSLADVGYANETEKKSSGSGLSTLERLALHQQYSNSDTKCDIQLGPPTSHSTPIEQNISNKEKKEIIRKITNIYKKDSDLVELQMPPNTDMSAINVNLTKHITFSVDNNGAFSVEDSKLNAKITPEKVSVETEVIPQTKIDKEIQTSLENKKKSGSSSEMNNCNVIDEKKYPIYISLNGLKKRKKRRNFRTATRNIHNRYNIKIGKVKHPMGKCGDQISEAESFEYMPGYIYDQNHLKDYKESNSVGNKSSLESSVQLTTDSSKTSQYSFTSDLEKSIKLLQGVLQSKYDNPNLKKRLIKEVVHRLLKTKYGDNDSATAFLSGLSLNSKTLSLHESTHTTTSTSDGGNVDNNIKFVKPKKSILRGDKFNANCMPSTSQSTPNLHTIVNVDQPTVTSAMKSPCFSHIESDMSSKEVTSSDTIHKMSSGELYKKYIEALHREQQYKRSLKDKELLLNRKLVNSDTCINATTNIDKKSQTRLNELIKDLVRNKNDDGSGDASKLDVGSSCYAERDGFKNLRKQRSHSVFTLASGKPMADDDNLQKSQVRHAQISKAGCSKKENHYCCCPYHTVQTKFDKSNNHSLQGNDKGGNTHNDFCFKNPKEKSGLAHEVINGANSPRNIETITSDYVSKDIRYVCLCVNKAVKEPETPSKFLIYECSHLNQPGVCASQVISQTSKTIGVQCSSDCRCLKKENYIKSPHCGSLDIVNCANSDNNLMQNYNPHNIPLVKKASQSSQTNINLDLLLGPNCSSNSVTSMSSEDKHISGIPNVNSNTLKDKNFIKENMDLSTRICEVTRCIQTKITINPKISNPSSLDVKKMNDEDCVKLISEQNHNKYLQNVPKNVENFSELEQKETELHNNDIEVCKINQIDQNMDNHDFYLKSMNNIHSQVSTNNQTEVSEMHNLQVNKESRDNLSIPIQGTNMTLVVSLGSNNSNIPSEKINIATKSQGIGTEKAQVDEKSTMFNEGCSVGIQSETTDIFTQINNPSSELNYNHRINGQEKYKNKEVNGTPIIKQPLLESRIGDNAKFNTYPKEDEKCRKKPFLRSNTVSGYLDNTCATQTQTGNKNDCTIRTDDSSSSNDIIQRQSERSDIKTLSKAIHGEGLIEKTSNVNIVEQTDSKETNCVNDNNECGSSKDPILSMIQDITKRYMKKDKEKTSRKRCFKDIITVLYHLLDTEEIKDLENSSSSLGTNSTCSRKKSPEKSIPQYPQKVLVDKGIQIENKKSVLQKCIIESSDMLTSTDMNTNSTDSTMCKVLNKIKKECEKYQQKHCKSHQNEEKKCETSSGTSNIEKYAKYCSCRHRCRGHKSKATVDKSKRKCVAYNLIIQTSDSLTSEEAFRDKCSLQNIVVKVPPKHKCATNAPFKEISAKIEKNLPQCSPRRDNKLQRSRSLPNDSDMSNENITGHAQTCTIREYLEKNRPDFVKNSSNRQNCLKIINQKRPEDKYSTPQLKMIVVHNPQCGGNSCMGTSNMYCSGVPMNYKYCNPCMQTVRSEARASERAAQRKLLSLQVDEQAVKEMDYEEIECMARELGGQLRRRQVAPKFISERQMKKHSEKIYKLLPEVLQKKEEKKKENIKKTNLLLADIFKKNLQKRTLRGSVNLSNYSPVVKI